MIELKERVRDALAGICEEVIYGYPADPAGRERVLWRESANRCHARADGAEYLAELNYTLEIFSPSADGAAALTDAADGRMRDAGFRREAAAEQFEGEIGLCHVTARYRALADGDGNIYQ